MNATQMLGSLEGCGGPFHNLPSLKPKQEVSLEGVDNPLQGPDLRYVAVGHRFGEWPAEVGHPFRGLPSLDPSVRVVFYPDTTWGRIAAGWRLFATPLQQPVAERDWIILGAAATQNRSRIEEFFANNRIFREEPLRRP
ncbi:MAG: hypothetical protein HY069_04600, partial [Chlamydiia bacterium]|nr:hypothetical protein [Chlamydiia bacterium]